MIVLGIETSTAVCSAAICSSDGKSWERRVIESHIHSEKLLTLIQDVCRDAQIALSAVDGVSVSSGPGSFTGLRIGMSAAKGLCLGLDRPLASVRTFDALADEAFGKMVDATVIAICLDARQGDYYMDLYERTGETVRSLKGVEARPLKFLNRETAFDAIVTDREQEIRAHVAPGTTVLNVLELCNALPIARRGLRLLNEGSGIDVASAEPFYLKDFVVRTGPHGTNVAQ
jgi:tRNA threonylcarbamoyladenosine biosynthesis protein TsaB